MQHLANLVLWTQDVESLLLAALSDPELAPHIDRNRVSLLGWSSGGNLACSYSHTHTHDAVPKKSCEAN